MGTQSEPSLRDDLNAAFEADDDVDTSAVEASEDVVTESTEEVAEVAAVVEEPELPPLEAPNTWKKDFHEKFAGLPRDVAEYIRQREEEASRGFTQKGQEIDGGPRVEAKLATVQAARGSQPWAILMTTPSPFG